MSDTGEILGDLALLDATPTKEVVTLADAERALKIIAVAETAETLWARAKDASKLFEAIQIKLSHQAGYAVWRQHVVVPSHTKGGPGRGRKRMTEPASVFPALDPGAKTVERWRKRLCEKTADNHWIEDKNKLAAALQDAQHRCVRICEQENANTIRGTEGTGEFERYTPAEYVEMVRDVLGTIDLDPASSTLAQETVQAEQFFDVDTDGLAREWHGRIFLNPPYHRNLAPAFIEKLLIEIDLRHTSEAILLTNNSTDTSWFQDAALRSDCLCFPNRRIHFIVPMRQPVDPTQGQAFFYFGPNRSRFIEVFGDIGICLAVSFGG